MKNSNTPQPQFRFKPPPPIKLTPLPQFTFKPPPQSHLSPFPGSSGMIGRPSGTITGPSSFKLKFGSKEPPVGNKANAHNSLKFGEHKSGVVLHGSSKEPFVMPPSWYEPCVGGRRVGTKHVLDVKFGGMPISRKQLLALARQENAMAKAYLDQSPPNKYQAHKHLARAQDCITKVHVLFR